MEYFYPPIHTSTRRYFDFPEITLFNGVAVLFLFRTTEAHRREILQALEADDGTAWSEGCEMQNLGVIPWLRNFTPDTSDALLLLSEYNGGARIFIDEEGAKNGTCIVGNMIRHKTNQEELWECEFGTVDISKALYTVSCKQARQYRSLFPDIISEYARIQAPERDTRKEADEWVYLVKEEDEWQLPPHIPTDLQLHKEQPTIISLIHLTPSELISMKDDIESEDVEIINWPSDTEPASEEDIWRIFEHVRPEIHEPESNIYGFFIDSDHLSGPDRDTELYMYTRTICDERRNGKNPDDEGTYRQENLLTGSTIIRTKFLSAWTTAFSLPGSGRNSAMQRLKVYSQALRCGKAIGNPDTTTVMCDLPIFLLQKITPTQERALRTKCRHEDITQLIHVPGGDGTFGPLMRWFQTPEFMKYNPSPPQDLVAADERAIASLTDGKEKLDVLLATSATVWHGDAPFGRDEVGYKVGRCEEACTDWWEWSAYANQALGLMSFIESSGSEDFEPNVTSYYWDCFDVGDKELEKLVCTRE